MTAEQTKQLSELQATAYAKIKAWVKYLEDLDDYKVAVQSETVPPGQPPPLPPGH